MMEKKTYFPTTYLPIPHMYIHTLPFFPSYKLSSSSFYCCCCCCWYVSRAPACVCVYPRVILTVSLSRRIVASSLRACVPSKIQRVMPFVHTKVDPKYRKNHYPHPDYSLLNIDTIVCLGMIATLVFTFWYTQF
jgi:hypothetical protein